MTNDIYSIIEGRTVATPEEIRDYFYAQNKDLLRICKEGLSSKEKRPSSFKIANSTDYNQAQTLVRERFGAESRAYQTIMNEISSSDARGSQFFFNNFVKGAISFEDLEEIYNRNLESLFAKGLYFDTTDLILRTDTSNFGKDNLLLNSLCDQVKEREIKFSKKIPLRIQKLEFVKDENPENRYGLLFRINDDTRIIPDRRFAEGTKDIQLGEKRIRLFVSSSGLSRVYLGGIGDLYSGNDDLVYSDDNGRVVVKSRSD